MLKIISFKTLIEKLIENIKITYINKTHMQSCNYV